MISDCVLENFFLDLCNMNSYGVFLKIRLCMFFQISFKLQSILTMISIYVVGLVPRELRDKFILNKVWCHMTHFVILGHSHLSFVILLVFNFFILNFVIEIDHLWNWSRWDLVDFLFAEPVEPNCQSRPEVPTFLTLQLVNTVP